MKALSLFNLNLEAFQLPCAGLSWEGVWLVQMLLPFLYPACCILHFVISYASGPVSDSARAAHSPHASYSSPLAPLPRYRYLLSFMARHQLPPTRSLMSLGWRPRAAFTFSSLSDAYGPPMFFFMNMYFYTGVQRSFEMIHCNYDGETPFLDHATRPQK